MPNGDPPDRFFYPTLTLKINSYIIATTVAENFRNKILSIGKMGLIMLAPNFCLWLANPTKYYNVLALNPIFESLLPLVGMTTILIINLLVHKFSINEPRHEISNNVVCATSKASDQPAHTRSLIRAFASRLNII